MTRRVENPLLLIGFLGGCALLALALARPEVNKLALVPGIWLVVLTVVRWAVR